MPRAWRILRSNLLAEAFDGLGAKRYPGRWNQQGIPTVYTSESLALATLEMLVHLEDWQMLDEYLCIPVDFDESQVQTVAPEKLPSDWHDNTIPPSTRMLGTEWIQNQSSPVLAVPSAVIPEESNYLLNPNHPAFDRLIIGDARPYDFDPRLR